jgi:hypothetical protein
VGHTSRSSDLLLMKSSWSRVSQSDLKTGGGVTVGGAYGTITDVASRTSKKRMDRCDRLRQTLLPLLCRFPCIRP